MSRRSASLVLRAVGASAVLAAALVLAACVPEPESVPSSAPTPDAAEAVTPEYHPDGSAEDNLPIFTQVTEQVWASDQQASGRAYIDALVDVGFDRSLMQVTEDLTTVGNAVESLQFSVRWGDDACLVGQVGPSTGEPVVAVLDQLAEGRCLVGNTRPIDW